MGFIRLSGSSACEVDLRYPLAVYPVRMTDEARVSDTGATAPRSTLRRDAERNRERIVAAARELYAEHGLGVGFNEVAHRAGVGVGTVYRRFADRNELFEAALEEPLRRVLEVADEATAAPRAWDGLVLLVTHVTDLLVENMGVRDAALGAYDELLPDVSRGIADVADELFRRAHQEGDLREGATSNDVPMILWMVTELAKHADVAAPHVYRRYVTILLDGLRAAPATGPLPTDAPAVDEVRAVSRSWADSSARARPRTA